MNDDPYRSPNAITEKPPTPVKVKAYGLLPLTRRTYLTLQVVLGVVVVGGLIAIRPIFAAPGHVLGFVDDYFVTIIVVTFALEGVETAVMLMKFKKTEREQAPQG